MLPSQNTFYSNQLMFAMPLQAMQLPNPSFFLQWKLGISICLPKMEEKTKIAHQYKLLVEMYFLSWGFIFSGRIVDYAGKRGRIMEKIALPNLNGPHPIRWRQESNKSLALPQLRGNTAFYLTAFELGYQFFLPLDLGWNIISTGSQICWF